MIILKEINKMQNYILPLIVIVMFSLLYSFFGINHKQNIKNLSKSIYDYSALSIDGDSISISQFKGKKILFVNVASKCGYTPQYKDLQALYEKYKDQLVVLGFPSNDFLFQEPAKNNEIKTFCETKYGVSFPMFEKIVVKKKQQQHTIYTWLSNKDLNGFNDNAPSWNFCKYLINYDNFVSSATKRIFRISGPIQSYDWKPEAWDSSVNWEWPADRI